MRRTVVLIDVEAVQTADFALGLIDVVVVFELLLSLQQVVDVVAAHNQYAVFFGNTHLVERLFQREQIGGDKLFACTVIGARRQQYG